MEPRQAEAAGWIAEYPERALRPPDLRRLVELTDGEIVANVSDYEADEELRRGLHASTAAHWRRFLTEVTRDPFEVYPPPEAFELVRTIVCRWLDITVLFKTYRVAQRAVWEHVARTVADQIADGDLRSAVLVRFWDRVSQWIDVSVDVLVDAYTEEREQWGSWAQARQAATVHAILLGDETDVDTATTALGYPMRQQHTAFVLWMRDGPADPDVPRVLSAVAAALGESLGSASPLTVASGARGLWGWVATPTPPAPDAPAEVTMTPGVRAAIGISAPGLSGFVRSHREALAARSVALAGAADHDVTRYADVELGCLAAGVAGPEGMHAMIRRELGGLMSDDANTVRLRRTLHLYLANGGSADLTGKAQRLHRNTIRYRIQQAEQLIGHPVHERRVYLELALRCLEIFGRPTPS